jgi:large-conductance mechanosensitive channel
MKIVLAVCVLFFLAAVQAETATEISKDKRDIFLTPIRQTVIRPAVLNRVVQPIVQDVIQPVITQKTFQTFVNPTVVQHHLANQHGVLTRVFKRSVEKDESKDKRDLFLTPIRQTFVRPTLINRVVQPIVQDVVQPVITQKTFHTFVNPTVVQHHIAAPTHTFGTGVFKRDAAN